WPSGGHGGTGAVAGPGGGRGGGTLSPGAGGDRRARRRAREGPGELVVLPRRSHAPARRRGERRDVDRRDDGPPRLGARSGRVPRDRSRRAADPGPGNDED